MSPRCRCLYRLERVDRLKLFRDTADNDEDEHDFPHVPTRTIGPLSIVLILSILPFKGDLRTRAVGRIHPPFTPLVPPQRALDGGCSEFAQDPNLRHDPARRRAIAGHLARRRREARDRGPARAPRRRRDRGRLPDRLAGRLRSGRGDREAVARPDHHRLCRAPASRTSTGRGKRCGTRERRASTSSSRRRRSTWRRSSA